MKSFLTGVIVAHLIFTAHHGSRIERLEAAVFMTDPELEALQK